MSDDIIDKISTTSDANVSENKFFCYPWSKYANMQPLKIPVITNPSKIYKKALDHKEISSQLKIQLSKKIPIPIILVGEPGSGKSTFIDFLMKKFSLEKKQSTDGILFYDIDHLNYWDCGGEKILFSTHHIMLPENCQYIITVNLNHLIHINKDIKNKCKNYTKYWMNEIFHLSTKSDEFQFPPVILLGSHADCINSNEKLEKATLKLLKMAKLYLKFIFIPHIFIVYDNNGDILKNNILTIKNQISDNLDNTIRKYLGLDNHSNDFYCAFLIYMLKQQMYYLTFENNVIIWWDEFQILLSKTLHVNYNIDKYIKLLSNLGIIKIYQYESGNQYKCVFIEYTWISKVFTSIISISNTLKRNNRGFFTQKQIAENLIQKSYIHLEWETIMRAIELFHFSIRLPSGIYYVPMLLHNLPDKISALDEKNSKNNKNKLIIHNFDKNNKKYKFIGRKYEFSPKIPFGLIDKLVIKFLRFSGIKIHPSTYKNDFYLFINENDYNTNSFYHILVQIIENNDFECKNLKISIYYPEDEEIINNLYFSLFCHFIFQSIFEFYDTINLIKNISIIDENNHEICEEKKLLLNFWNFTDFHKYLFPSDIKIFDIDNYYFKFNNYLNLGCFGPVWDGIMYHGDNLQYEIDFICKELLDFTYNDYKTLLNEIILLKSIKNPFIIEILGISKASTYLLEEKSKKNQIFDNEKYLQNQILIILEKPGNYYKNDNCFSTKLKIKIAYDILKAVCSLYSNAGVKIIQHEINSNNIFIFSNDENLISDFHFVHAKLGCFNNQFCFDKTCYSKFYKDFRYSPPEICIGNIDTCNYQEIDVYSFGILFWELLCNEIPFENDDFESFKIKLENEERPPIDKLPNDVPYDIIQLIQACWNSKPNLRPNFETIIWIIETVLIQISSKSCVSQTNALCLALYNFPGDNFDELPFLKNEIIEIIITDDLWYQGSIEGKQGLVPRNYIQLLSSFNFQTKFYRTLNWFDAIGKDQLSFRENDIIQIRSKKTNSEGWFLGSLHGKKGYFPPNYTENIPFYKFIGANYKNIYRVICSFIPTRSGELLLHEGDIIDVLEDEGDWWKGSLYSKQGFFPASCVQKIKYFPGLGFKPGSTRDKRVQIRKRNKNFSCRALYAFKGENTDELTFKENDIIRVLDESTGLGGGWYKGLFNGKIGFFPASYVKKIRYYPGIRTSRRRP